MARTWLGRSNSGSAMSSDLLPRAWRGGERATDPGLGSQFKDALYLSVIAAVFFLLVVPGVASKVFYSQAQALELAFPEADRVSKMTHVLSLDEAREVERLSGSSLESRLITLYNAWRGDKLLGHINIDVHTVRTRPEGLMIVLDPKGRVVQVRVLAFQEPLDYMPVQRWYELFVGKTREDRLRVGYDIDGVTGATLTTRATADAVKRMLAYHKVLLAGKTF